jgi:hypothetical protein
LPRQLNMPASDVLAAVKSESVTKAPFSYESPGEGPSGCGDGGGGHCLNCGGHGLRDGRYGLWW